MNLKEYIVNRCQVTWELSEDNTAQVVANLTTGDKWLCERMGHDTSTLFDTVEIWYRVRKKIDDMVVLGPPKD